MNRARRLFKFLLERKARVFQPTLIDEINGAVRPNAPGHRGNCVNDEPHTLFDGIRCSVSIALVGFNPDLAHSALLQMVHEEHIGRSRQWGHGGNDSFSCPDNEDLVFAIIPILRSREPRHSLKVYVDGAKHLLPTPGQRLDSLLMEFIAREFQEEYKARIVHYGGNCSISPGSRSGCSFEQSGTGRDRSRRVRAFLNVSNKSTFLLVRCPLCTIASGGPVGDSLSVSDLAARHLGE